MLRTKNVRHLTFNYQKYINDEDDDDDDDVSEKIDEIGKKTVEKKEKTLTLPRTLPLVTTTTLTHQSGNQDYRSSSMSHVSKPDYLSSIKKNRVKKTHSDGSNMQMDTMDHPSLSVDQLQNHLTDVIEYVYILFRQIQECSKI